MKIIESIVLEFCGQKGNFFLLLEWIIVILSQMNKRKKQEKLINKFS